jgi:hypothetical protein
MIKTQRAKVPEATKRLIICERQIDALPQFGQ